MARPVSDKPKDKLTLSLDKELKRRFDLVCRWKEITMSQVATELFEAWLEKNTPPGLFELEDKSPTQGK